MPDCRWDAPSAVREQAAKASRTAARANIRFAAIALTVFSISCGHQQNYSAVQAAYFHGKLPEVIRFAEIGKNQHLNRDLAYWQFRLLEAEALLDQGKTSQAVTLLSEPVPAEFGQLEVRRLIDSALANRGNPDVALALLQKAQDEATDQHLRTQIAQVKGVAFYNKGDLPLAEAQARKALDLAQKAGSDYYSARALLSLGFYLKEENRHSEAADSGERALVLATRIRADRVVAQDLLNLGYLYAFFGDFQRAVDAEKRAGDIFASMGDEPNHARALGETGLVLGIQGQPNQAIVWYRRAFEVAQREGYHDANRFAGNLALAYLDLGQWDQAEHWNKSGQQSNPHVVMNSAEIAFGRGQYDAFFRLCNQVIQTAKTPALKWQAHGDLARAYAGKSDFKNAFVEYGRALDVFEDARSEMQHDDVKKITFLPRLMMLYQGYVAALVRANRSEEALQVIESSRARVLADQFGAGAKPTIKRPAIASNTVLLSFWIAPEHSFLWLMSGGHTRRFDLPAEDKIIEAVTEYKTRTEKALKDPLAPGFSSPLWGMLLEQAAPYIPLGSRVVVVPDGPLHQLNLETLVVPKPQPHYWLNDVELVIAPSLSLAPLTSDARPGASPQMLLIGAPDYQGTKYPPLRYADEELRRIRKKFPNASPHIITGPSATPEAYRGSHPDRFSIIHFAAHAEANQENPLESAVLLSRSGDDFRLYARDIFRIPIHADLVTVSACRSAGSKAYAGEGLIGFAWAFLASGGRNVIGGLWDVDDESTAELMSELYAGIASGLDPVAALHQAKLKLLKDYPKPYYWGPFQVYSASK